MTEAANPTPLRLLLVSQGLVGKVVQGHAATARMLAAGLADQPGVTTAAVSLPPRGVLAKALSYPIPGLAAYDLDAVDARWLAVEAWAARRRTLAGVRAFSPDVIHVNSHVAALGLTGLMRRVPTLLALDVVVADLRAMEMVRPLRAHSRAILAPAVSAERTALRRCAAVVAYSQWAADAVHRLAPLARVEVIHPGVDVERFHPVVRTPRQRPRVLFVGGRFAAKGGHDLIAALAPWLGDRVDLDIVTPDEVAARPGLTVHRLSGEDPALGELFAQADLFCLPSKGEGLPWVLLEALASGTPVVASPAGATEEVCGPALGTGALVPAGDVTALRAAIDGYLVDTDLRTAAGRRGRELVLARFEHRRQAERLVALARGLRGRDPLPAGRRPRGEPGPH